MPPHRDSSHVLYDLQRLSVTDVVGLANAWRKGGTDAFVTQLMGAAEHKEFDPRLLATPPERDIRQIQTFTTTEAGAVVATLLRKLQKPAGVQLPTSQCEIFPETNSARKEHAMKKYGDRPYPDGSIHGFRMHFKGRVDLAQSSRPKLAALQSRADETFTHLATQGIPVVIAHYEKPENPVNVVYVPPLDSLQRATGIPTFQYITFSTVQGVQQEMRNFLDSYFASMTLSALVHHFF